LIGGGGIQITGFTEECDEEGEPLISKDCVRMDLDALSWFFSETGVLSRMMKKVAEGKRTIIAGSRGFDRPEHYDVVEEAMATCPWVVGEVVSGTARGVDQLGERWAETHGLDIQRFPANWDRHGRAAGPIRNREMAEYAEALVAIWDGKSAGTKSMISEAKKAGLEVHVHTATPS